MMEVYASRSRTRSGWLEAMTLTNELKHTTHCWMVVIFLGSLGLSLLDIKSMRVTSGAPKRHGSSSLSSMNSPFLIFSASFLEIGGECDPTANASIKIGGE